MATYQLSMPQPAIKAFIARYVFISIKNCAHLLHTHIYTQLYRGESTRGEWGIVPMLVWAKTRLNPSEICVTFVEKF